MSNRIKSVEVRIRSLTPAEAELWITVHTDQPITPATEVRGRLMGPACPYASTIEAAYPLRPLLHAPSQTPPLTMRVVIPEPSLWDPISPFLYRGPIELWQGGQRCDQVQVQQGLASATLTRTYLRWNGQSLPLRGQSVSGLTVDKALSLRQSGINLLMASSEEANTWELASRYGFLILGDLSAVGHVSNVPLFGHVGNVPHGVFGWLLPGESEELPPALAQSRCGLAASSPEGLPAWTAFVVCNAEDVPRFAQCELPLLVRGPLATTDVPVIGTIS